ncbi:MAG: protein kinase [Isosphaeraceae bacterium]
MSRETDSWDDLHRDLMADWNPEPEEEGPPAPSTGAPAGGELPSRLERPWRPEEKHDSFPSGPTALCRAFALHPPEPPEDHSESPPGADRGEDGPSPSGNRARGAGQLGRLPRIGEEVKGFLLRLELGRGAFARVFLAEEINLGHRLVALKVSQVEGEEPKILARLQHPHIVPVHSVHDDPGTGLRLLCMPFLGGANLAQLLQEAWGLAHDQATGRSLVDALDHLSQRLPAAISREASLGPLRSRRSRSGSLVAPDGGAVGGTPDDGPPRPRARSRSPGERLRSFFSRLIGQPAPAVAGPDENAEDDGRPSRRFLRGANGIQASAWIVARLAEGLDHAHERGLLHRDLKPANVLVAADGTPMLLDFNLAAEAQLEDRAEGGAEPLSRAVLGGTLPYMSPEHLDAFDPEGSTRPDQVDERSDLYALGLILFEMVSGERPFPEPAGEVAPIDAIREMRAERGRRPVPSLKERCPDAPWSLDALVSRCLDPDPDRRYDRARDLAEDLRRFLEDLPMKHCREPSLRERAAKWTRRHPTLCSSGFVAAAGVVLLALFSIAGLLAYDRMLGLRARMRLQAFQREFTDLQFRLNTAGRREETLRRGVLLANAMLHREGIPDPSGHGKGAGASPPVAGPDWIGRLPRDDQLSVRRDLIELLMLEARGAVALAMLRGSPGDDRSAVRRAIARLDQAARLDAPAPSALFRERAGYHERLGERAEAAEDRALAATVKPASSRDLTLQGAALLEERDLHGAEQALRVATALDVTSPWAWFVMGHCHFELGRYADAVGDFTASVAGGPGYAWTHFNRGLALARTGRLLDARLAYDQALAIDPDLIEARVNRGIVALQLDQTSEALADLKAAVAAGCREVGAIAALAGILSRQGRSSEADALFVELLDRDPGDPVALVARGMTCLESDREGAERDFRSVLDREPRAAMALYGMARLVRFRDRPAALAHLDRALDADPELMDALQLRALERAREGLLATLDDVERLIRIPTPQHLYNAACALALLGEKTGESRHLARAVDVLVLALRAGFPPAHAAADPDLRALQDLPEFIRLRSRFHVPPKPTSPAEGAGPSR